MRMERNKPSVTLFTSAPQTKWLFKKKKLRSSLSLPPSTPHPPASCRVRRAPVGHLLSQTPRLTVGLARASAIQHHVHTCAHAVIGKIVEAFPSFWTRNLRPPPTPLNILSVASLLFLSQLVFTVSNKLLQRQQPNRRLFRFVFSKVNLKKKRINPDFEMFFNKYFKDLLIEAVYRGAYGILDLKPCYIYWITKAYLISSSHTWSNCYLSVKSITNLNALCTFYWNNWWFKLEEEEEWRISAEKLGYIATNKWCKNQ